MYSHVLRGCAEYTQRARYQGHQHLWYWQLVMTKQLRCTTFNCGARGWGAAPAERLRQDRTCLPCTGTTRRGTTCPPAHKGSRIGDDAAVSLQSVRVAGVRLGVASSATHARASAEPPRCAANCHDQSALRHYWQPRARRIYNRSQASIQKTRAAWSSHSRAYLAVAAVHARVRAKVVASIEHRHRLLQRAPPPPARRSNPCAGRLDRISYCRVYI